jgi:hypothetical protein
MIPKGGFKQATGDPQKKFQTLKTNDLRDFREKELEESLYEKSK